MISLLPRIPSLPSGPQKVGIDSGEGLCSFSDLSSPDSSEAGCVQCLQGQKRERRKGESGWLRATLGRDVVVSSSPFVPSAQSPTGPFSISSLP